jgi:hypothetical protein
LAFLVILKTLIPDPNYNPILTEPADTPIGLDFALNQLNGKCTVVRSTIQFVNQHNSLLPIVNLI